MAQAENDLQEALAALRIKQESLKEVQNKLAALERKLADAQKEKEGLKHPLISAQDFQYRIFFKFFFLFII